MLKVNWKPDVRALRAFGWTLMIGFGLIGGAVRLWGNPAAAPWIWGVAGGAGLLAVALPNASLPFYWVWIGIGFAVGSVMSRVVMAVIFYGVLTPLALFFKLKGRDALALNRKPEGGSLWTEHPKIDEASYYDHLF
jgi:hypothetical protein